MKDAGLDIGGISVYADYDGSERWVDMVFEGWPGSPPARVYLRGRVDLGMWAELAVLFRDHTAIRTGARPVVEGAAPRRGVHAGGGVKSALTKEEWEYQLEEWGPKPGFLRGMSQVIDKQCHPMAALCLHGQEFGFTREMVSLLGRAAYLVDLRGRYQDGDGLREISEIVAALLPPEVPIPTDRAAARGEMERLGKVVTRKRENPEPCWNCDGVYGRVYQYTDVGHEERGLPVSFRGDRDEWYCYCGYVETER